MVAVPVMGFEQSGLPWYATLTRLYTKVPETSVGADTVKLELAGMFNEWEPDPLML